MKERKIGRKRDIDFGEEEGKREERERFSAERERDPEKEKVAMV